MFFLSTFRLISAAVKLVVNHEGKVIHAPAVETEADTGIVADPDATIAPFPAAEIEAKRSVAALLSVKLIAYNRAAGVFIRNIFTAVYAGLEAPLGAIFRFVKAVKVDTRVILLRANSAVAQNREKVVRLIVKADQILAGSKCTMYNKEYFLKVSANVSGSKPSESTGFEEQPITGANAAVCTGEAAETESTRVVRLSLLSKLIAYNRAAANYFYEIITQRFSKMSVGTGVMTGYEESTPVSRSAVASDADSVNIKNRDRDIVTGCVAAGCSAIAQDGKAEEAVMSERTAIVNTAIILPINVHRFTRTAANAVLAIFIEDILQNGTNLYIRQIYESQVDGNSVYIVSGFLDPLQSGHELYIRQVHESYQTGSELDLAESVFYDPVQTENDLYIKSVASIGGNL